MTSPLSPVSVLPCREGYISSGTLPAGFNREALVAWHRAHGGGLTLVMDRGSPADPVPARTGYAAIDDVLSGDAILQQSYTPEIGHLKERARGRIRAIRFQPPRQWDVALLDRDGTIIEDRQYLAESSGVALLPGAAEGLRLLGEAMVKRVVLTNQSGVASGRIPPEMLMLIHRRMTELLVADRADIDGIYTCPHAPADGCRCRKPATELAFRAQRDLHLDLDRAFMVGDKDADVELARRLGLPAFLVTTGEGLTTLARRKAIPDFLVDGLDAVARIVLHPGGLPQKAPLPASARDHL